MPTIPKLDGNSSAQDPSKTHTLSKSCSLGSNVLRRLLASIFALFRLLLAVLLEEQDKEDDERHIHKMGGQRNIDFCAVTASSSDGLMQIDADVDEASDKLHNLGLCQVSSPPNLVSKCSKKVVDIHHHMDPRINNYAPERALKPTETTPTPSQHNHNGVVI
mmetsp:Transcript_28798/g.55447  ORF Transcript_28798/g.55447 Transcript_28798/m.55447 type:complete len:162 (+) Transcript_28798:145-630(+)